MGPMQQFFSGLKEYLSIPLFQLGDTSFTLWTFLYLTVLLLLLIYSTGKLKKWTVEALFAKSKVEIGVRQAMGSFIRYVVVSIGFVIILQTAGIDLSALTILAGALGVGVGFGLQNITNNLVSGLIILLERPIKVGIELKLRASTVMW